MANFCRYCGARLTQPAPLACPACHNPLGAPGGPPTVAYPYQAAAAGARLIVQEPGQAPRSYPIAQPCITIGRETGNDLVTANPAVSRQHARIELRGADYWVIDLISRNGTSVNGRPVTSQKLNPGDIIRIGDQQGNSVGLTFEMGQAGPPAPMPGGTIHLNQLSPGLQPVITLGRDPSNQVPLNHPSVSRHHATVEQTIQGVIVRDLGSATGTYINGQPVRGARPLNRGDVIQIGPFKLVYDQSGLTSFAPSGNYRLDAIGLKREVSIAGGLAPLAGLVQKFVHTAPARAPTRKLILNDVTLSIYPREFVALVGGSGAGKSTLMNALNGFVPANGRVLLNGDDLYANFAAYRSTLGYVPQDDIIHSGLTVRGALFYAARLRLPDASPQEIEQRVNDALGQVEMEKHADKLVAQLSGGQRKRVSIAVELLAEPGLFFLDEPTSGLDPGLEKKMMYTLRQLADAGRTIVLVTHATANITQCTHVAFMADGRLVYFGPPSEALKFFDAHDFADIYTRLSQPIDPVKNPLPAHCQAYYQQGLARRGTPLPSSPSASEVWECCFRGSPQYQQYVAGRVQGAGGGYQGGNAARQTSHQRVSPVRQFAVLAQRYFDLLRRDTMSLFILLAVMPLIGLLLLVMAKPSDLVGKLPAEIRTEIQQTIDDKRTDQDPNVADERFQGFYDVTGDAQKMLFMLALAANLLGVFAAAYEIVKEQPIYRRERMVNLQIVPYLLSKLAILGLFALIQCLLLLWIVHLRVKYPEQGVIFPAATEMYITLFLATLAGISMGLFISAAVRSSTAVIYVVLLILFVQIIFAGAIFDLPPAAKPISYVTATRWTLEALGSTIDMNALRDSGVSCIEFEDDQTRTLLGTAEEPCKDGQMRQTTAYQFNVTYDHKQAQHLISRWLALAGFVLGFGGLAFYMQKRKDVA